MATGMGISSRLSGRLVRLSASIRLSRSGSLAKHGDFEGWHAQGPCFGRCWRARSTGNHSLKAGRLLFGGDPC
jgi:hypothetical protein